MIAPWVMPIDIGFGRVVTGLAGCFMPSLEGELD